MDIERGSLLERLKKYLPVLIPVFISTIRNTNVFGMALESKGFGARKDRTFYLTLHMHYLDYFLIAFGVVFSIASIVLGLFGFGAIPGLKRF